MRAYLAQVDHYAGEDDDEDFALHLDNTEGRCSRRCSARARSGRADLLDEMTHVERGVRMFAHDAVGAAPPEARAGARSRRASRAYLDTIPESKRFDRELFYDLRDVVGKSGFGIGSAGLPAYNLLVEGYSQALDNDVVLSMKQANVPALSRFVDSRAVDSYFEHEGHRTVVSQRALQVHTDPLLGYTELDGVGYVVAEVSPYEVDLDWENITEPDDMAAVVDRSAGRPPRCTAPATRTATRTSSTSRSRRRSRVVKGRRRASPTTSRLRCAYAETVRRDHALSWRPSGGRSASPRPRRWQPRRSLRLSGRRRA